MATNARINITEIMQKYVVPHIAGSKRLEGLAYGAALGRVNINKQVLVKKFEEHKVTKELRAGEAASSKFLSDGNLHSFIGFYMEGGPESADEQLDNIKDLLKADIRVRKIPRRKTEMKSSVRTVFEVETPIMESIWDLTPYPNPPPLGKISRSGSWAKDLENSGIDGFAHYFYLLSRGKPPSPKSRSTTAFQIEGIAQKGKGPGPINYIKELLEEFRGKL